MKGPYVNAGNIHSHLLSKSLLDTRTGLVVLLKHRFQLRDFSFGQPRLGLGPVGLEQGAPSIWVNPTAAVKRELAHGLGLLETRVVFLKELARIERRLYRRRLVKLVMEVFHSHH